MLCVEQLKWRKPETWLISAWCDVSAIRHDDNGPDGFNWRSHSFFLWCAAVSQIHVAAMFCSVQMNVEAFPRLCQTLSFKAWVFLFCFSFSLVLFFCLCFDLLFDLFVLFCFAFAFFILYCFAFCLVLLCFCIFLCVLLFFCCFVLKSDQKLL